MRCSKQNSNSCCCHQVASPTLAHASWSHGRHGAGVWVPQVPQCHFQPDTVRACWDTNGCVFHQKATVSCQKMSFHR